jgi:enoyl-CoA hydratase
VTTAELQVRQDSGVLTVTFNRPEQRNAMTFAMYEGLEEACERADTDDAVRVLVLRGAGGRAFVAGTDISQFLEFRAGDDGGADGLAYEERITRVVNRLEEVTVPTVAAVEGACVGGGLALAAACHLRLATRASRFGVPIARTLGNCLSMNSYSLLVHHLGPARTLDMLLRARLLAAEEARGAGFVGELVEDGGLDEALDALVRTLLAHAPLSMKAAGQAVARLRRATLPDGDDLVREVFGSEDFRAGVRAFVAREQVTWRGR